MVESRMTSDFRTISDEEADLKLGGGLGLSGHNTPDATRIHQQ